MRKIIMLGLALLILFAGVTSCKKAESNPSDDVYKNEAEAAAAQSTKEAKPTTNPANEASAQPSADPFADLDYEDQFRAPVVGEVIAVMTTSEGVIKLRLFEEAAPKAVENFVTHSKEGYYDGLTFHRVMNDFMIQGGDPTGTGKGGESIYGGPFEDEFAMNYLLYPGALCMANSGPATNGSQFFIVQSDAVEQKFVDALINAGFPEQVKQNYETYGGTPWLFYQHTTFGQVFEGMEVVEQIAMVEVDSSSKPVKDVIIEKIEIVEYK